MVPRQALVERGGLYAYLLWTMKARPTFVGCIPVGNGLIESK